MPIQSTVGVHERTTADLMAETSFPKTVTCSSQECQDLFNKGLLQAYGFNHEEAIRCFEKCLSLDSNCIMAHFFISHCYGPNYNNSGGLNSARSHKETQKALSLIQANETFLEWEVALIEAQVQRFCSPADQKPKEELTRNYANAMREVYKRFDTDPDIVSIFAEALMMLAPWALWTPPPNITAAIPETLELVSVLEKALKDHPQHPALCHYYVHTMELSATPEKAMPEADVLRKKFYQGHLFHMAAHIDMWVGHYKEAVEVHEKAIAADEDYRKESGQENNFYKLYRMHDYHFMSWAAMFNGQFAVAIKCAEEVERQLDKKAVTATIGDFPVGATRCEAYAAFPWHVLVRFGKWEDIIQRPVKKPVDLYPAVTATSRYARAVAFAALGRLEEAEKERSEFKKALSNKLLEGRFLHNNKMHDPDNRSGILDVAEAVLDGEVEYHMGNYQLAFQHLRLAVERDTKQLVYDEPWGWMMPTRHALGALLLEQGEPVEAEAVYRDDLKVYKNNLWALFGLSKALESQGKLEEAATAKKQFEKASLQADVKIKASCFCATKSCCL